MAVDTQEAKTEVGGANLSDIGEICSLFSSAIAKVVGDTTKKSVETAPPQATVLTLQEYQKKSSATVLLAEVDYSAGIQGKQILLLADDIAGKLGELLQGEEISKAPKLKEESLSALREVFDKALAENLTNISAVLGNSVQGSITRFEVVKVKDEAEKMSSIFAGGSGANVTSGLTIADASLEFQMDQLVPLNFGMDSDEAQEQTEDAGDQKQAPVQQAEDTGSQEQAPVQKAAAAPSQKEITTTAEPVEQAQFSSLAMEGGLKSIGNIELLLDVTLDVSIELGRTKMNIKEILGLGSGSIIELEKAAGEAADFLVNGKVVARGEVVVIDGKFGIRITEIVSPRERLESI